ncbi:thioesterase II family protein [Streptomyces sp. NPDC088766]|uniref:thioesterase II family protein n=1 Tax=Streptomyces sp. NPDC088766 TaxID=3365893 RepID=UPI003806B30C
MSAPEPLTLYCVPHAGGSARSFVRWRRELPPAVVVARPLEIAGKGLRSREPRATTLREAAADLAARVDPGGRYALFGHSMGGLLAHETAQALARLGRPAPAFVVVAAARPPHLLEDSSYGPLLELGDDALLDALAAHGRIPREVRTSPMRHQFVPVIRGDLALLAGYRTDPPPRPLTCDLLTWYGTGDPDTPPGTAAGWRPYTRAAHRTEAFAGGHFFPHELFPEVARRLVELSERAQGRGRGRAEGQERTAGQEQARGRLLGPASGPRKTSGR